MVRLSGCMSCGDGRGVVLVDADSRSVESSGRPPAAWVHLETYAITHACRPKPITYSWKCPRMAIENKRLARERRAAGDREWRATRR